MINYTNQIKVLLQRLLIVYSVYFLCRLFFFMANRSSFSQVSTLDFMANSFYGLRFDTFSIFLSNAVFLLFSILPSAFFFRSGYQNFLKWVFIPVNAIFILPNCVDMGYFAYIKKRSSADLFNQLGGQTDILKLLPQYVIDFWWVTLIYILLVSLMVWAYNRVKAPFYAAQEHVSLKHRSFTAFIFVLFLGLFVLGLRGGLQRNPLDIVHAGGMTRTEEVPLVLNTPFTLIKTMDKESLAEHHFYDEATLQKKFNPIHHFNSAHFTKQNVVVLILESFAKEYTRLGKTISYTPFLDSLMDHSLVFTNAYANGAKSIEGIPAILSSLPSLMENPLINSAYANNYQTSFASILNRENYTTAFFHGGINGTMNFDTYARLAGYQMYHGMDEYNNPADFDGYWGIWDEPFLHYTVKKMSGFKQPFHASIFTLSSHHPYKIPSQHKNRFPKGHLENLESIGYADHSLKLFFEAAQKTEWFRNTLFVLCADHCSLSDHPYFRHTVGLKSIPILFFKPDNSLARTCDSSFSQIDILPSVMNLLGYNKPFFSFGQSFLNRQNNNCYYYENGATYAVCDTMLLCYNGTGLQSAVNIRRDSLLIKNWKGKYPAAESRIDSGFRAFVQKYNHVLIHNEARVK